MESYDISKREASFGGLSRINVFNALSLSSLSLHFLIPSPSTFIFLLFLPFLIISLIIPQFTALRTPVLCHCLSLCLSFYVFLFPSLVSPSICLCFCLLVCLSVSPSVLYIVVPSFPFFPVLPLPECCIMNGLLPYTSCNPRSDSVPEQPNSQWLIGDKVPAKFYI